MTALHELVESPNRRAAPRHRISLTAEGASISPESIGGLEKVVVHSLSRTGALIEGDFSMEVGADIDVCLPDSGSVRSKVVWADKTLFGCEFEKPISNASLKRALLRAEPLADGALRPLTAGMDTLAEVTSYRDPDSWARGARILFITGASLTMWAIAALLI